MRFLLAGGAGAVTPGKPIVRGVGIIRVIWIEYGKHGND
jgi:hypothetical protein